MIRIVRRKHNRLRFQFGSREYLMSYIEIKNYRFIVIDVELLYHNYMLAQLPVV